MQGAEFIDRFLQRRGVDDRVAAIDCLGLVACQLHRGRSRHTGAFKVTYRGSPEVVYRPTSARRRSSGAPAELLYVSLLKITEPREPAALVELLNLPRAELKHRFKGRPAEALIDPGAHEQGAGIVATVANAVNQWAETRRGWVFLNVGRVPDSKGAKQLVPPPQLTRGKWV